MRRESQPGWAHVVLSSVMGPGGIVQELRELASGDKWEAIALCAEPF